MKITLAERSTICNDQQLLLVKSTLKDTVPVKLESMNHQNKYSVNRNINREGKTSIIRKGLGCRRSRKDMLSPEEQQVIESGGDKQQDGSSGRRQPPRKPPRSLREAKPRRRLVFTSPRVIASDKDLFPSNHSLYKESSERWQQISDQAGSHRQDGTIMNIGRRPSTANAFRMGMIGCAAVRVRYLNLWVDHEKDILCDWLKMIAEIFVNLEHLTLTEDLFPGEDDMAVSARMRRLYVLSILPNLKSIDDMVVTSKERGMANPGGQNDQHRSHRDKLQSPSSESIRTGNSKDIDSKDMSKPEFIDTDSVRTSRANGIEVEFLSAKCWEVKQTETETTASSSPTSTSETTITATDSDNHFEYEQQNNLVAAAFLNDTIAVTRMPSMDGNDKYPSGNEMLRQVISIEERDIDLTHCQKTGRNIQSKANNIQSSDDVRSNVTSARVRAFHSDSNNSIELVPVTSTDLEWSGVCDVSNVQKKKSCAPVIQLPFYSEDTEATIEEPNKLTKKYQNSMAGLQSKEREQKDCDREASARKACTPVQRQSKVIVPTPQVGCCQILRNDGYETSQFSFPTSSRAVTKYKKFPQDKFAVSVLSANQQVPPSKSLSSPFPMQFRERQKPSSITAINHLLVKTSDSRCCYPRGSHSDANCFTPIQNGIEVIAKPHLLITSPNYSPEMATCTHKTAQKGELLPPCPFGKNRHRVASDYQPKKIKPRNQKQRIFHNALRESARSTSVMDLDEEEEFVDNCIQYD